MSPVIGLALVVVLAGSVMLAMRAGSNRRAAAIALMGGAIGFVLLRQMLIATTLGMIGWGLWRTGRGQASAPKPGQRSEVRSRGLAMTLDHDTGEMDGRVRTGPYTDRTLSELTPDEIASVAAQFEDDEESLSLLMAYLERTGRQTGSDPGEPSADGDGMSEAEAYRVLGLAPGADREAIRVAYRRLMRRVHPDLGGSDALAAMINTAKERLDPGSER